MRYSESGAAIAIYGQMTTKGRKALSEIIPLKQEFTQLPERICAGICGIFSEQIQENREISVSLVKISKNGCRRRRVVV